MANMGETWTLYNALLSFGNMHMAEWGGSNYSSLSYGRSLKGWRVWTTLCLILLLDNFIQFFIVICRCVYFWYRRIQLFSSSSDGSKTVGGWKKSYAHLFSKMTNQRDFKLCTMLHWHLWMCILENPIIFLKWIQEGWMIWHNLQILLFCLSKRL
jgi:hypothetical protein